MILTTVRGTLNSRVFTFTRADIVEALSVSTNVGIEALGSMTKKGFISKPNKLSLGYHTLSIMKVFIVAAALDVIGTVLLSCDIIPR